MPACLVARCTSLNLLTLLLATALPVLLQLTPPTSSEAHPAPSMLLLLFVPIEFRSSPLKCLQSLLAGVFGQCVLHHAVQVEQLSTVHRGENTTLCFYRARCRCCGWLPVGPEATGR